VLGVPLPADSPLTRLTDYELRHLISHLIATGRAVDLHRLLELELADGRNAWFEAKGAGGRTGEYAADLAAAWQLARTTRDIPRQLRYALMSASVRSHWQFVSPDLLSACVGAGVVSWPEALSIAEQIIAGGAGAIEGLVLRAAVGAGLMSWSEALSIVEQMPASSRGIALEELAPVIQEEGWPLLLDQPLALTDSLLKTLAPRLPLALVRRVLPAVQGDAYGLEDDAAVQELRFHDDDAVHELIFRLAELGEVTEALDLFTRYRSVPLALRLASLLDDQERLFGDDAFLVAVLNSGGADAVDPMRLGAWAERVLSGPADERTTDALLASFARLPRSARDLIDPLLLCAASGNPKREVSDLVGLVPALDEPARRAVLRRAVTLTLNAPVSERDRVFGDIRDPVRLKLCRMVAPALAVYGDRRTALKRARLAFETALRRDPGLYYHYSQSWQGDALVRLLKLADGAELDRAVRRLVATRNPWLRLNRMVASLPFVTDRYRSRLLPRIREEIANLGPESQADFLVDLLRWLPPHEREDALTAALQTGGLLRRDSLELPGLVESLPPQARRRFLDRLNAAACNLTPAAAAMMLLAIARSSEPDRRPALLLEAARVYRDGPLDPDGGRPRALPPFTADELEQLDLRELLDYYQVPADERELSDHQDRLRRVLEGEALAERYAEAGDLKTALTYGPLTASLLKLAIPAAGSSELMRSAASLSPGDRVQACIDLAREGPLDILGDVVEIARSFGDVAARGEILLSAAERAPDHAEAVRLGQRAWELAVESGVIRESSSGIGIIPGRGGITVPWVRGRWLGSAAIDVLLPLLPEHERADLLRRTLETVRSLMHSSPEVLLQLSRLDVAGLRETLLAEERAHDALRSELVDLGSGRPISELERASFLAPRLCVLGEPDRAIALLRELPEGYTYGGEGSDWAGPRGTATADLPVLLVSLGFFSQAVEALQFLPEESFYRDTPRLDVFTEMLPDLTRGDAEAAQAAVFATIGMRDRGRWLHLLSVHAQVAAEAPSERRWDEVLKRAASMNRAQALGVLEAIRPVTRALGGLVAVEEEARSVSMVRRWWPPQGTGSGGRAPARRSSPRISRGGPPGLPGQPSQQRSRHYPGQLDIAGARGLDERMDPVSLVVAALVAGAAAGVKDTAGAVITDLYASLKALIRRRFGDDPAAGGELTEVERGADPAALRRRLEITGVDEELANRAAELLRQLDPEGAQAGKYRVEVSGGQGAVIGDNATVTMNFGE
jgi:hypothetical protein